ncbi:uncharacterized protein PRCAT00000760001 [Priceomyces carsonii]|uniref:uncharacterized protein n=1 Tax=Priceomyces carsonii TaxID=28549 RepID=UPI002EDA7DD3|nr:unnamed protein product [Priceomyces carsonii]
MTELYFLRHGQRINEALLEDSEAKPLLDEYQKYDPSLSTKAVTQMKQAAEDICNSTQAFTEEDSSVRKNIFIHFSPYLRCCQSADLLITNLKEMLLKQHSNYKVRFQLLGDFALSDWIHDEMKDKPPFIDSNDAYQMYTPNLKTLKNKSACSNFRPTITLGQFNGPDLSYKDFQARCKSYFKKLLATYERANYIKNRDIVIVVTHGYVVSNFLSYFISRPIFNEIPEAKINLADRILRDDAETSELEEFDPSLYTWKLTKDCLNMLENDAIDSNLNLETDIIYYKTNFIKKNDPRHFSNTLAVPESDKPRPSFKVEEDKRESKNRSNASLPKTNYLCSSAKNWTPQNSRQFKIKADFKLKVINDDSFKKRFNIINHPIKPISPEVLPNSEPSRSNSVIDLTKLVDNDDIYKPMKLKYATTSNIPIARLNSKVNSQVSLAQCQRLASNPSNENSKVDLPKYISIMKSRNRSTSNPPNMGTKKHGSDSYFPQVMKVKSNDAGTDSPMSISSSVSEGRSEDIDMGRDSQKSIIGSEAKPHVTKKNDSIGRSKSLNTRSRGRSFAVAQRAVNRTLDSDNEDNMPQKFFSLSFSNGREEKKQPVSVRTATTQTGSNLVHFIPTINETNNPRFSERPKENSEPIFYQLHNGSSSSSDSSEDESDKMEVEGRPLNKNNQYIWFGQNR